MVHINVSVHTIIENIHLLVTYAILPVWYCIDAPLRRYATLIVVRRLSGGWAKWLVDANLAARQKKNYFITSAVDIPKMICNTWLNDWCNAVGILSTDVAVCGITSSLDGLPRRTPSANFVHISELAKYTKLSLTLESKCRLWGTTNAPEPVWYLT